MRARENGLWIRENVVTLPAWDPTLLWYARGVGALWTRPQSDPISWRFQGAIHERRDADDPLANGDPPPSKAIRDRFWNWCQHGGWFFLPWHRAYLGFFERMVRAEIVALGGPQDWALPYWNYSDGPASRLVRPEFRAPTLPDGGPNPLSWAERGWSDAWAQQGLATGDYGLNADDVALDCLERDIFAGAEGVPSFGGARSGHGHSARFPGRVEVVPHGSVHGGIGGWMGAFHTAGLDPLFWLHHANIDRLWAVWRAMDPGHQDPGSLPAPDGRWLTPNGLAFEFHDETRAIRRITAQDMADTAAGMLKYVYDDVSDPLPARPQAAGGSMSGVTPESVTLAGASDTATPLSSTASAATLSVVEPPAARPMGAAPRRVYLNIENIMGTDNTAAYRVYVGGHGHEPVYAGLLPTFGVNEASDRQGAHGADGLTQVLDVTDIVQTISPTGELEAGDLDVRFVPTRKDETLPDLSIGRVSLYYG